MSKSPHWVYATLALSVAAVVGCPSSTTAPNKPPVGGMWVANFATPTMPELATAQLTGTSSPTPANTLVTPVGGQGGLALDASGNMWVSSCCGDTLLMYSREARNSGGTTAPTTVIVSSALNNANNLAFDSHGNLWVTNCGHHNILQYTPAQQAAGGTQDPAVSIAGGAYVLCPWGLAFDSNGNLWVGDDQRIT